MAPWLPVPVFTGLIQPELRRSSTHPTEMRAEWAGGVSDGMTRLSLREVNNDDEARLFGSPGMNSIGPVHHSRNHSGDAMKRLSLQEHWGMYSTALHHPTRPLRLHLNSPCHATA